MRNEAILVVDDEEGILIMLENLLRKEGYTQITKAGSAAEALMAVRTARFDMIVLDVMLPDTDGFSLCVELRKTVNSPILFLTARSSDLDKLQGLYLGGDDYVTKPFNPMEVIARIQAHLRRRHGCWGSPWGLQRNYFKAFRIQARYGQERALPWYRSAAPS